MALNLREEIRKNKKDSIVVLIIFTLFCALLFAIASSFFFVQDLLNGDFVGFITVFVISMLCVFGYITYFLSNGDKMILAATGATEATNKEYPHLFHATETLAIAAGVKKTPKCYIIEDSALNAYATGFREENAYIVVTTGLIKKLNRQELEGVLAHEMAHIKNNDIQLMLYVAGLIGIFTLVGTFCYYASFAAPSNNSNNGNDKSKLIFFGLWILFSIIGVFFATLFKFKLSRQREFLADSTGAYLTRYPKGLADALRKISNDPDPLVDKANKATAHMFISTPFRKTKSSFAGLFATHPPVKDRIAKLEGK